MNFTAVLSSGWLSLDEWRLDLRPRTHKRLFGFDLDRGLSGKEMKLEMGLDSGNGVGG